MSGLGEWRRAQRKAREDNRNWNGGVQGRNPATSPMYGRRQAGREQPAVAISPPNGRFIRFDFLSMTEYEVVESAGWPHETMEQIETIPASGYYDLHQVFDREGLDKADVTLTVEINGEPKIVREFYAAPSTVHTVLPFGVLSEGDVVTAFYQNAGGGVMQFNTAQSVMQLVDRQVGEVQEPTLGPWAWYRGDDLTGYNEGDPVTLWTDRTDGNRHVEESDGTADLATFTSDAVGGQPGTVQTSSNERDLRVEYPTVDTMAGVSVVLIGAVVDDPDGTLSLTMDVVSGNWVTMNLGHGYGNFFAGGGYTAGEFAPGPAMLVGVWDGSSLTLWHNGVEVVPTEGDPAPGPGPGPFRHILHEKRFAGSVRRAETAIYDRALSSGEIASLWADAQQRYGL